jgi:hypothetical protein
MGGVVLLSRGVRLLDIPPVRPIWIYRGLIFGYTAELAGFAAKKKLDKMCETDGFCGRFS